MDLDLVQHLKNLHQVHELLESGRILLARQMLEKILDIKEAPAAEPESA